MNEAMKIAWPSWLHNSIRLRLNVEGTVLDRPSIEETVSLGSGDSKAAGRSKLGEELLGTIGKVHV